MLINKLYGFSAHHLSVSPSLYLWCSFSLHSCVVLFLSPLPSFSHSSSLCLTKCWDLSAAFDNRVWSAKTCWKSEIEAIFWTSTGSKFGYDRLKLWQLNPKTIILQMHCIPDNKVHEANMGPTWVLSAPDGPHVGPINLAIRNVSEMIRLGIKLGMVALVVNETRH